MIWLVAVVAEETPEVSKDQQDLVAEASQQSKILSVRNYAFTFTQLKY